MAEVMAWPKGTLCENCGTRPAAVRWVDDGGALAFIHGFFKPWCHRCATAANVEYAEKQAAGLAALRAELTVIDEEEGFAPRDVPQGVLALDESS